MGRKSNYFRHSFEAHNDIKLQKLLDQGGLKSVGAYFILLEIYGREVSDNDIDLNITTGVNIHIRRIATAFRLRSDSTRTQLELIANCKLIELVNFQYGSSTVQVSIPNFSKYFGSYKKNEQLMGPNKRKGNKIKEKEIKTPIVPTSDTPTLEIPIPKYTPDDLVQLWNDTMPSVGLEYCRGLGSGKHLENYIEAQKFLPSLGDWKEVLEICRKEKTLNSGDNKINWKVNLLWLVDYDNCLKVLNGNFKSKKTNLEKWAEENIHD